LVIGEAAFGVIALVTREFAPVHERAVSLVHRLEAMPTFLGGAAATLREAPVPSAWLERALVEAAATSQLLREGLPVWCKEMRIPAAHAERVNTAAGPAAAAVDVFADNLRALATSDAEAPPCGEEHLALCVRRGHWIDRTLDDLHHDACERLAEARSRLDALVRAAGARSLAEVQERLAARHPTAAAYYDALAGAWQACRDHAAQHDLVTWPEAPVRFVPIPPWTRMAAPRLYHLHYRSPAPLEPWDAGDYVVPPLDGLAGPTLEQHLRLWNDAVLKLNHVVHHGALGHHVQNWHAHRAPSRIGRIAATDCASRIAMLLGGTMAEGWACYATDLMEETGFLTADESVAEQHTRLRLLARAINDLEFHRGRRALRDAERFYQEEVGMSAAAARSEAVKNSMFPGTAMMYWLGTQGIHDLRRALEQRDGSDFRLRTFHDTFLSSGAIPVALQARLMLEQPAYANRRT
jgi:uncharacterized protein (DUF885 family)